MSEADPSAATGASRRCRQCGTQDPTHPDRTHGLGGGAVLGRGARAPSGGGSRVAAFGALVRAGIGWLSGAATWIWALVVLAALLLIRWVGDRWWGVTVLLFLPRWMFLAPLPVLALASGVAGRPRHWLLQGVVTLLVAGPLMSLALPLQRPWGRPAGGTRVRIMTLNLGQEPLDVDRMVRLIEQEGIDLICFQEGNSRRNPRLEAYLAREGWHRDRKHALASRYPIVAEMPPLPEDDRVHGRFPVHLTRTRIQAAPGVEFWLASVHMPTLRFGFYRFMDRDVEGLKEHVAWWDHEIVRLVGGLSEMRDVPLLVGGDFNMPPDHAAMVALGSLYRFAFEDAGWGYGYTRPTGSPWFRIDHILASPEWAFTRCWVGPDFGSDHLPLIAEAVLPAPAPSPPSSGTDRIARTRE